MRERAETAEAAPFGFQDVPLAAKQGLVDRVFHSVANRYDLMNDLMSGTLHRAWKNALVTALNPPRARPAAFAAEQAHQFALLDLAGGTGDVAFRALAAGGPGLRTTVADVNGDMLAVGRERAEGRGLTGRVDFVEANAETLPFSEKRFDAVAIAFGIRNVPRIEIALSEIFRVLKPAGRFLCLEFSSTEIPGFDALYELYSFRLIPEIGRLVAGDAEPYRYLVESIRQFPQPEDFAAMMRAAGFSRAQWTAMSGGIVALHSGWRL
jgi:demethylmenaquinone methyltransferase/2-methoxy-6-polyprenyl-1,4-benzoquinol methylase